MTGIELYEMKRATGLYDDYDEPALLRLFLDCQNEAEYAEELTNDYEIQSHKNRS